LPAERETEARHGRVRSPVQAGMVLVAWLMVVMGSVIFVLRQAPGLVVAFELYSFVNRKGRNSYAREAEVIGAVIVSGFGMGVRTDFETEILRRRLYGGIKRCSLGPGNLHFFGCALGLTSS